MAEADLTTTIISSVSSLATSIIGLFSDEPPVPSKPPPTASPLGGLMPIVLIGGAVLLGILFLRR